MNISNDKKSFYQWETNRFLVDEDFKINQEVCFSSVKLRKALVVKTKLKNNKIVVEVPNLLLQDYHPIMVHWVIADENGKYVTKEQEFQVLKRAKPEDYVYTETEIFSFLDLEQRLKNLEEEGINKAIVDYFVKNPIQSGATSEQAAQIIQNKENIEKLNKNKLDADKLPEAINNALAQAEASGAFKGEPGKDGVVPVTGAAVGQTVKITTVDENGNPTEWEATDFPESSKQTDWNQNDESAHDYVKNRTHYEEENIIDIAGLEYVLGDTFSTAVDTYEYDTIPLEVGQKWFWQYQTQAGSWISIYSDAVEVTILDDGSVGMTDGAFIFKENKMTLPTSFISATNLLAFKIVGASGAITGEPIVHHLDPKYIKDMYYEIPSVWIKAELIDDNWSGRATCKLASTPIEWTVDNSYRIRIDGVEYVFDGMSTRKATAATGMQDVYYIGATYIPLNSNMDFLEYKFCLLTTDFTNIYVVFEDATTNHTIEFFESEREIHHLDPKYIKDMYYEEVIKTDITGASYIIDGFDTSTLTVSHDPIPLKLGQVWEENHKHYSGNWTSAQTYEVQQADDGTLYLGTPISAEDNIVTFYLTENELSIEASLMSAGYGTFKFTCISGVTDESIIHKLDSKYLDIATDDEILEMLAEIDMLPTVTDGDGSILADENENILLW